MPFDGQPTDYAPATVKPTWATVTGLRDWLATKNPATGYFYCNSAECLLTQWHEAMGVPCAHLAEEVGGLVTYPVTGIKAVGESVFANIACTGGGSFGSDGQTFGAALYRCNALIAKGAA